MANKEKILIVGSSNTDITVRVRHLPSPGETVIGGDFIMGHGGKGANQAVAVSRLGGNAEFVCMVGNDLFGRNSMEQYKKEGISIANCFVSDKSHSGLALISVDDNAENSIVVASGTNADISIEHIEKIRPLIEESSILLLQLEIPVETVLAAAEIAYRAGVRVILNPAPARNLPEEIFKYLYLIIPNQTELSTMTGIKVTDIESARQGIAVLRDKGLDSVIVTMGSKGALVSNSGMETFVEARKVEAIDTTAAGDTFCGGVCVGLAEGKDLEEAVRFATVASSLAVCKMGAQDSIPYRSEVDCKL